MLNPFGLGLTNCQQLAFHLQGSISKKKIKVVYHVLFSFWQAFKDPRSKRGATSSQSRS